ncbi:MAG: hypothetical protein WCY16_05015 [Weeksellaceae bacterium]
MVKVFGSGQKLQTLNTFHLIPFLYFWKLIRRSHNERNFGIPQFADKKTEENFTAGGIFKSPKILFFGKLSGFDLRQRPMGSLGGISGGRR